MTQKFETIYNAQEYLGMNTRFYSDFLVYALDMDYPNEEAGESYALDSLQVLNWAYKNAGKLRKDFAIERIMRD